jgi:hypothetical protein
MDQFLHDMRLQELKALEEEISLLVRDTRNLELYVTGGLVAYYGWLLSHCVGDISFPWWVPIVAPIVGGWRSAANFNRILEIAGFIREMYPSGWEDHIHRIRTTRSSFTKGSHVGIWSLLLLFSVSTAVGATMSKGFRVAPCKASSEAIVISTPQLRGVRGRGYPQASTPQTLEPAPHFAGNFLQLKWRTTLIIRKTFRV